MIELVDHAHIARLVLRDKVRVPELGELRTAARAALATGHDLELELAESEHLHAGALQILLALEREALAAGRTFRITAASQPAHEAFALAGLSRWNRED